MRGHFRMDTKNETRPQTREEGMSQNGVLSHESFIAVDWAAMKDSPAPSAANALGALLAGLDGIEEQVYAARGMAGIMIEDRALWTWLNYPSFDKCLKAVCPKSWSYVRDAMRTIKELREIPLVELLQIKRCNLVQLIPLPARERQSPEVLDVAKNATEAGFSEYARQRFPELHLEHKCKLVLTFTAGDYELVCSELDDVGERLGISDREGELLALLIDRRMEREGVTDASADQC